MIAAGFSILTNKRSGHRQSKRGVAAFVTTLASGAALSVSAPAIAGKTIAGPIPAAVERVVDGDTVRVRATIWIEQEIEVAVRVADIDAPELFRPKCPAEKARAREAQAFVRAFFGDQTVYLHEIKNGKYAGRVVARLTDGAGRDLGEALVDADLAVAAKRGQWCKEKAG
ncbi:MAG: thermonuclease family protein [Pseudomonadota bacterium]